jgi:hypothetical protein
LEANNENCSSFFILPTPFMFVNIGSHNAYFEVFMKKLLPIILSAFACAPTLAAAQPLMTYTYADVAYQWTHVDESGINDANGLDTQLSISPVKHFALEGGYNYAATKAHADLLGERFNFNLDQNAFTYGGAGWYSIQNDLDIVARVGGISARATASGNGVDESTTENGVYTGLTLRYLATQDLETDIYALYDHVQSTTWTYGLTGLYKVHENIALKGEAAINDDTDIALLAGVRFAMQDLDL